MHAGDLRAELRHVGTPAHTTNDSIVWLPEQSVLFCGDLVFNGGTPFLLMGSVSGAIEVLEDVVAPLGAATVVPGHGPVFSGDAPIDATLDYLRFVLDVAERGAPGRGQPAATRPATPTSAGSPTGPTPSASSGNLYRAYAELGGTPRGGPIDVFAALGDMVAYNGGRPLTCLA